MVVAQQLDCAGRSRDVGRAASSRTANFREWGVGASSAKPETDTIGVIEWWAKGGMWEQRFVNCRVDSGWSCGSSGSNVAAANTERVSGDRKLLNMKYVS